MDLTGNGDHLTTGDRFARAYARKHDLPDPTTTRTPMTDHFTAAAGEAFDLFNEDGTYCTRVVALEPTPGPVGPGFVLVVANPDVNYTAGVPVSRLVRRGDGGPAA